jgi:ribose 5-phosphate isomerase A
LLVVSDLAQLKEAAAAAALDRVLSGMKLGLGTGSTAAIFVRLLGERLRAGTLRDVVAVSTSVATETLAREEGIRCTTLIDLKRLDLTVDGADEIDERLRLVKGRGGALLREKIVEQASDQFIVIADDTKKVPRLGVGPFPIEVVPFATELLLDRWSGAGIKAELRRAGAGAFITDEGNRIIDVMVPTTQDIADFAASLRCQAGVVETGLFETEATEAFLASAGGIIHMTKG